MNAIPVQYDRHRNMYEDPLAVFVWWYDLAIFLMMFPSNSIIVFLRKNLGFRLMRPWIFWAVALLLLALSKAGSSMLQTAPLAPIAAATGASSFIGTAVLWIFVAAMLVLLYIHRRRGWKLILQEPNPVHTFSRGESYLAKLLPIPDWIIQRYVEPVIALLVGLFFILILHWYLLGCWLIFAGGCLGATEALMLAKMINQLLDMRDGEVESDAMQQADQIIKSRNIDSTVKIGGIVVASPEIARLQALRLKGQSA